MGDVPGNTTQIDAAAIIKSVTEEVTKAMATQINQLGTQVTEIVKNQKVLSDTIVEQGKLLQSAQGGLTDDKVKGLIQEAIKSDRESQQQSAAQQAALAAFVKDEKNGLAKLPAEFTSKLGSDPAKWPDEAKGIVANWEKFVKDNGITVQNVGGGANRDGGETPGSEKKPTVNTTFLGDNTAKQAAAIKMPQ